MKLRRHTRAELLLGVLVFVTCAIASATSLALAHTWQVARDGSGEFTVLQDALNAAVPGDSVIVGPGRYAELHTVAFPLASADVAAYLQTGNITIVGAGANLTQIGPAVLTRTIDGRETAALVVDVGVFGVSVNDLALENVEWLALIHEAVRFSNCAFRHAGNVSVALLECDGTTFVRCEFQMEEFGTDGIISYVGDRNPNTAVEDCQFAGNGGFGILLEGAQSVAVERCSIVGMSVGLQGMGGYGMSVRGCTFASNRNFDIVLGSGLGDTTEAHISESSLGQTQFASLRTLGPVIITGVGNVLTGGPYGAIWSDGGIDIALHNSDILNGGGPTVLVNSPAQYTPRFDLRSNYWGTLDTTQISAWIQDGADPPPPGCDYCPAAVVQFEPILRQSVPTEANSFGGLKALFGGGQE